mmetsp:Transcript_50393/g.57813  ORF Transcript_50393/g.57813 Transcript_50393/m.57813 type:complete len:183 (-) Transcript_50393:48-596(-)
MNPEETDSITLSKIKKRTLNRDEDPHGDAAKRVKMRNYTSEDSSFLIEEKLATYYCRLCGGHSLISNQDLEFTPRRRTDQSRILVMDQILYKKNLEKGEVIAIKRDTGYEKRFQWNCKRCGMIIGYNCLSHEDADSLNPKQAAKLPQNLRNNHLYILKDALIPDLKRAEVHKSIKPVLENSE